MLNTQTNSDQFVATSRDVLQTIRSSLIELYSSIGVDPQQPQDVARRIQLNRNLTWKLSRVITAPDPFSMLNHLPGKQGLDLSLAAFEAAGAPAERCERVRQSIRQFMEVVTDLAGDREQFESTLQSMGLFEPEHRVDSGRELAFRGEAMIWGVQAKTRVCCMMLAPSGEKGRVDCVQMGGLIGFRRLRANASWRLFRRQVWDDAGTDLQKSRGPEPTFQCAAGQPIGIVSEFSSPNMPEVLTNPTADGVEYVLPGGPVGKNAAFDCYYAHTFRNLPQYRDASNTYGATAAPNTMPAENLIVDMILHRDVPIGGPLEALVYGFPHGGSDGPTAQTISNLLPISAVPVELAGSPPAVATMLAPRYDLLHAQIYQRMGWNPSEFRGFRVHLNHPPMSSRLVLRFPLPHAPID